MTLANASGVCQRELGANPGLDARVVHDLNDTPGPTFADDSFDAVMIVVSIQYLTRYFDVSLWIVRGFKC